MGRLEGKVALITGVASGIGAACAARFAAEGAAIAGLDVAKPTAETWDPLVRSARDASFAEADVRDEGSVRAAVGAATAHHGKIDVLVNAAGVSGAGPAHLLEQEEWNRVLDINLKGSYLVSKHVLPSMLEQHAGSIIHLASVEGLEGMSQQLAYNVSKGGVVMMAKNMAIDYGPEGIRVNCLCPGAIDTPMTQVLNEPGLHGLREQMRRFHVLDRFGRPEEVAAAALFLASDESSFVTGTSLIVDGGFTAGRRIFLEE